ncbi:hypothetical protein N878_27200 [Pseudomonas sp. EGD-AK9]|nr:hypothetical protein N878_27200 [Pseudomonas sp. EGD-AK9]
MDHIGADIEVFQGQIKKLTLFFDPRSIILNLRWRDIKQCNIRKYIAAAALLCFLLFMRISFQHHHIKRNGWPFLRRCALFSPFLLYTRPFFRLF